MSPVVKRLSWALAISLGVNVFLVGFGSARWLMRDEHVAAHELHGRPHRGMHHLLGKPSAEFRQQREALRTARAKVGEAIAAEPFERERMVRALTELRETTARGQQLLHERLLERVSTLPIEQRREFARGRFLGELGDERPEK